MSGPDAVSAGVRTAPSAQTGLRVAFVGAQEWLDACAPATAVYGLRVANFPVQAGRGAEPLDARVGRFRPHATVIFDPASVPLHPAGAVTGATLGILVHGAMDAGAPSDLGALDRLVSFDPALTGEEVGGQVVWRSLPPPVSDSYYAEVRPLHEAPRAMTIGASNEHREAMLMPAKHHHDVLQLIHGVWGSALIELLREYDVGIFVAETVEGGFGYEAAVHLAAGQLLLAAAGKPAYGLERNIDYLHVGSADELVWMLGRLGRFPEMHNRVRVRGRLKAEQFRASRVFARVVHDLLLDVAAFAV